MNAPSKPLLALALDSAAFTPDAAAARVDPAAWLELVLAAQRHGVSLVTLGDTHRGADGVARLDALMLAAWLGARSTRIGILPSADTTVTEPYLLASQVATADFVSAGWAGWLVAVSGERQDAAYVGPREAAVGEAAWTDAAEFVAVVRSLWDSWEDDAEIRDVARHRFIDAGRIHHIDFSGEHLAIKGPSITPRPPQGQPPVALALSARPAAAGPAAASARALAVAAADIVFLDCPNADSSAEAHALRSDAAALGRELRVFVDRDLDTVSAADVGAAGAAGCDGVRLMVTRLPEGLEDRLGALVDALGTGVAGGPPGTLRDRLGLPRPSNRYATSPR